MRKNHWGFVTAVLASALFAFACGDDSEKSQGSGGMETPSEDETPTVPGDKENADQNDDDVDGGIESGKTDENADKDEEDLSGENEDPVDEPVKPGDEVPGCSNECDENDSKCADNAIWKCEADESGCLAWKKSDDCSGKKQCDESTKECIDIDKDDCEEGEVKCAGALVSACKPNENGFMKWVTTECDYGQFCQEKTHACGYACGDPNSDDCKPFSIILLSDMQGYSHRLDGDNNNIYEKQLKWIADNADVSKENIKFAIGLGDITDNNYDAQWEVASKAFKILDNANVPYSVITGNHDYIKYKQENGKNVIVGSGAHVERSNSKFTKYFNDARYKGKKWFHKYAFSSTGDYTFEVGGLKFLVIGLEFAPRKEVLCWADDIIKNTEDYHDRYVITSVHNYIYNLQNAKGYSGGPDIRFVQHGATGAQVARDLTKRHSNIVMAVGGHVGGVNHRVANGNSKNEYEEILCDYQFETSPKSPKFSEKNGCGADSNNQGNGWFSKITIDPINKLGKDGKPENNVKVEAITVMPNDYFPGKKPVLFCSEKTATDKWKFYSSDISSDDHKYSFFIDFSKPIEYKYNAGSYSASFTNRPISNVETGQQKVPRSAINSKTGESVVVWMNDADDDGKYEIMGRRLCATGCTNSEPFAVSTTTKVQHQYPDVAMNEAGDYVIIWNETVNGSYDVKMQGYKADGTIKFKETVVNTKTENRQAKSVVAMAKDGSFVVAWEDESGAAGKPQAYMRGFNADGTERFATAAVAGDGAVKGMRAHPAIDMKTDGTFVVAWEDDADGDGKYNILARVFNADGSVKVDSFVVNAETKGSHRNPDVGMNENGTFFVAYEDDSDGDKVSVVKARGFGLDGRETSADKVLSSIGRDSLEPSVCVDKSGRANVVWRSAEYIKDGKVESKHNIYGRSYKGNELSNEFNVLTIRAGYEIHPHVACRPANGSLVSWQDDADYDGKYTAMVRGFYDFTKGW